jgi:hypothetical protein
MTDVRDRPEVSRDEWWSDGDWNEWWKNDRLDSLGWAAIFSWAALVVLATYTDFKDDFDSWDGWGVFFVGAGAIVLLEAVIRLLVPRYRARFGWTLFWGTVLLALGLGGMVSGAWYALPLAAVAVLILYDVRSKAR